MKKTMLYTLIAAAIISIDAIVIVGCNGDLGSGNEKMYEFLEKFRGEADNTVSKYIVKYDANGGKNDPPAPDTVFAGRTIRLPGKNTLTKDPLVFVGWNTESSGGGNKYGVGADYTPTSNVTLYAEWKNNGARYDVIVSSAGTGSYGGSSYQYDDIVSIYAGTAPEGQQFKEWTATPSVSFASKNSPTTSFRMPSSPVTATAVFEVIPANKYAVTVLSDGSSTSGGGSYSSGDVVTINAGSDPFGHRFKNWTVTSGGVGLADANNRRTTFTMPANAVTVTANFEKVYTYKVTVVSDGIGASKDSSYREGDTVTINAGTTPSADKRFKGWTVTSGGVTLGNAENAMTKFVMPANAVTVTANFGANTYTVTIVSVGIGASGGGDYPPGVTVTINAGTVPIGYGVKWMSSNSNIIFGNANSATTTFIMPSATVTVTAKYGFTDSRDGQIYTAITIGGKTWMAENLNYQTDSSWCVDCAKYGQFYTWNVAKNVCLTGWHLSSFEDWRDLVTYVGDTAAKKLRTENGWYSDYTRGTDDYGFSVLPSGESRGNGYVEGQGRSSDGRGVWWASTETYDAGVVSISAQYGDGGLISMSGAGDKYYGRSVRCVKDD